MISDNQNVVAVGGMGGSGSRVVATLIEAMGFYMGNYLNQERDNITFTRLFKNPDWFKTATRDDFNLRFHLFVRITKGEKLTPKQVQMYLKAVAENHLHSATVLHRAAFVLRNRLHPLVRNSKWAWKEPNTHIMIDRVIPLADKIRYIHVLRHGLDMAFSKNRQQLINWGWMFGLDSTANQSIDIYRKQLEFWIRSTKRVLEICPPALGGNFYVLNYNRLLNHPEKEIESLAGFLNADLSKKRRDMLTKKIIKPRTDGRYKTHDLSIFSDRQLDQVREFGFQY